MIGNASRMQNVTAWPAPAAAPIVVAPRQPCRRPRCHAVAVHAAASSSSLIPARQPFWTGDELASRAVNVVIASPLYGILKFFARQAMKDTARRRGINWDAEAAAVLSNPEVARIKAEIEDTRLVYPAYYQVPMHSYADGNLCWLAAAEMKAASAVIACRVARDEITDASEAIYKFRTSITGTMRAYLARQGAPEPSAVLDVGCSTGISSRWLAREFSSAEVTGLDASPYFLAVAEWEQRRNPLPDGRTIRFDHALAESTPYPDASFDMVTIQYVAHESPAHAIRAFIAEARRLLRPGGVLAFVDNNPQSPRLQSMPPAMFTLMKSSEPWSDEFYSFNMEGALQEAGFKDVWTVPVNTSHCAVLAQLPTAQ